MACRKEEQRMDANRGEKDGGTFNRRIVKGLRNIGNTCFFNSVMQNLLAVDLFRDHFMKPPQFPEGSITSALRKLYVETSSDGSKQADDVDCEFTWWSTGNKALNPEFLFSAICAKVRQFRGLRQQDSHELLRCLLDNLDTEELVSLKNSKSTNCGDGEAAEGNTDECSNQRNHATLVDRVFQGQLCSTICCSKCGYRSVTYEPFYDLSLSLPSKPEDMKVSLPSQNDPSSSKTTLKNDEATTSKSVFGLLGGCESPLLCKATDSVAGDDVEVTQTSAELNTDDVPDNELDVSSSSIGDPFSHEDIWHFSDNDDDEEAAAESCVVDGKNIDVCESESPLYGGNDGDNLFKAMPLITETMEDAKPAIIPMSVEGCLVEFTNPETLSGENEWRCPNCASKLVNGSDNLENARAKGEQGEGFNGRLNGESIRDSSAQGVSCSDAEGHSNKNVFRIFGVEERSETDGINNAERPSFTISEEEGIRTSANLGKWDLESQNFTASEEVGAHGMKKKRSKTIENEANFNDISQKAEGHSNKSVLRNFGVEESSEIDGINRAERPASTSSEKEGIRTSANLGKWNFESQNFTASEEVEAHGPKKKRSKTIENEAKGHSNKNVLRIFGVEESSEIDGMNRAEKPAFTSSEKKGIRTSANLGKWDFQSQNFTSSEEGHRLKKKRLETIENEANINGISQEATKRYLIGKAPPILTIHLKRFKHGSFGILNKLSDHVAFQETLDLRPYMESRSPDKDDCLYRLIGVVEHGGTMDFGHYVAYVRGDQDGSVCQWFNISDSLVRKVSSRAVLASEAYILFYEKV